MEWLGQLLATFVGGGMAILGGYLTYRMQEKQRTKVLYREKGEELYSLVEKWMNACAGHFLPLTKVMSGEIDYNQYLDLIINTNNHEFDYSRVELFIKIYFPDAKQAYTQVIECRDKINKMQHEHKRSYKMGEDGRAFGKPFIDAQQEFYRAGDRLKQEIIKCIRAL